jgi:hypothetical protein
MVWLLTAMNATRRCAMVSVDTIDHLSQTQSFRGGAALVLHDGVGDTLVSKPRRARVVSTTSAGWSMTTGKPHSIEHRCR